MRRAGWDPDVASGIRYCGVRGGGPGRARLRSAVHRDVPRDRSVGGPTTAGYRFIRRWNEPSHRAWMIRSYALTLAAVTLRIYLRSSSRSA
jgi:hypothetical protein